MKLARLLLPAILLSVFSSQIIFANEVEEMDIKLKCTLNTDGHKTEIEIQTFAQENYYSTGGSELNSIYVRHNDEAVISKHTHLQKLRTAKNSDILVDAVKLDRVMNNWYKNNKKDLDYISFYEIPGHVVARFMRKNDDYESWVIPFFRPNHSEIIELLSSDCR